jgi:hypothetical protein
VSYIVLYLLVGVGASIAITALLPREFCLLLAAVALLLGVIAPLAIWGYANFFVPGDKSSHGMLGTILAVLFAPAGLALGVLNLFKRD